MTKNPKIQRVNLSAYEKDIESPEDRPLFHEAVLAAKAGALRSAYIVTWLSCAESLKRRFREASIRDHAATKVIGRVTDMEKKHNAVDKHLLDQALKYGFISDPGYTTLFHIYEMRCLYGHPYEEAPSKEKLLAAASDVVDLVLSKPVKLRHGFADQLLNDLLSSKSYVDDQESAVAKVIESNLPRLDENIHVWMLEKYWNQLEGLCDDPSMALFVRRGVWFSRAMLTEIGVSVLDHDQWHKTVMDYPKTMVRVCSSANVFEDIGPLAQDAVIGSALQESETRASVLSDIEGLYQADVLSERNMLRFDQHVSELQWPVIRASSLSTKTCYERLLRALRSGNYDDQNTAIRMLVSNGPEQAIELPESQQTTLGRAILRAAEDNAWDAIHFVDDFSHSEPAWPVHLVIGITLELFTDMDEEIRFRVRHINRVFSALDQFESDQRELVVCEVIASIDRSILDVLILQRERESAKSTLENYPWAEALLNVLNDKVLSGEKNKG